MQDIQLYQLHYKWISLLSSYNINWIKTVAPQCAHRITAVTDPLSLWYSLASLTWAGCCCSGRFSTFKILLCYYLSCKSIKHRHCHCFIVMIPLMWRNPAKFTGSLQYGTGLIMFNCVSQFGLFVHLLMSSSMGQILPELTLTLRVVGEQRRVRHWYFLKANISSFWFLYPWGKQVSFHFVHSHGLIQKPLVCSLWSSTLQPFLYWHLSQGKSLCFMK